MKSIEELKAYCGDYLKAQLQECEGDVSGLDEWFTWGGYSLNIFGSYWGIRLNDNTRAISVDAYPENWEDTLPDALHTFDITGETA